MTTDSNFTSHVHNEQSPQNAVDNIINFLAEQNATLYRHLLLNACDEQRREIIDGVIERLDRHGVLKNVEQYSSRVYGEPSELDRLAAKNAEQLRTLENIGKELEQAKNGIANLKAETAQLLSKWSNRNDH